MDILINVKTICVEGESCLCHAYNTDANVENTL